MALYLFWEFNVLLVSIFVLILNRHNHNRKRAKLESF